MDRDCIVCLPGSIKNPLKIYAHEFKMNQIRPVMCFIQATFKPHSTVQMQAQGNESESRVM